MALLGGKTVAITEAFHLIAKPSGPICNLDCTYCFYTEKESLFKKGTSFKMNDEVLEQFILNYIHKQNTELIPFVWQGGEPLLLGIDYYKKVLALQEKHRGNKKIHNSIQTNGTLLNDDWAKFFKQHDFLVGLSMDGPDYIHDKYRVDRGQRTTFDKIYKGMKLLQKYDVPFNILVCITNESLKYGPEIYRFFVDEGVKYIQFTPIVERVSSEQSLYLGLKHGLPPKLNTIDEQTTVSEFTVDAESYGDFLIQLFNIWVSEHVGDIFVLNFEHALVSWLGLPAVSCLFSVECGRAAMIEHNGDVYSCDHFMYPDYKLGNILSDDLAIMLDSHQQKTFGTQKKSSLPKQCLQCEVRFACNGECPKHRFLTTEDGEPGLNYLCKGYRKYFNYIHKYMKVMVQLIENDLPVSDIKQVIKGPLIVQK